MTATATTLHPPRVVKAVAQVVRGFSPEEMRWFVQLVPVLAETREPALPAERLGVQPVGLSAAQMAQWKTLSARREAGQPLSPAEDEAWGELVEAWLSAERATMIEMAVAVHGEQARRTIQRKLLSLD
ncbi:MAG: hypothetical protein HY784_00790 [Chloroflexi bacterium]|nr:hypothetical protein [Chloroflexota bacterium]